MARHDQWRDVRTLQELDDAVAQPGLLHLSFGVALTAQNAVAVLHRLASLRLQNNSISAEDGGAIAAALETNATLTTLVLWGNSNSAAGARAIAAALEKNRTLTTLVLQNNSFGAKGAGVIAAALEKNATLTTLDLSFSSINAEGARLIAAALEKNATLTTLDLQSNSIRAKGARAIGIALEKNATLTSLNLHNNSIGDEGARAIGEGLGRNATLKVLTLQYNNIGDEGAQAIGAGLERNAVLTTLSLSYNSIGERGARAIAAALEKNTTLTTLSLDRNNFSRPALRRLAFAVATRERAIGLQIYDNEWKDMLVSARLATTFGVVPVARFPLFLCGYSGVGKTTLSYTLEGKAVPKDLPAHTHGVATRPLVIAGKKFSLWDFAGQMEYYATHEFFLHPVSQAVFLVCVRGDEGLEQAQEHLRYWLRFIKSRTSRDDGRVCVWLVVTHMDLVQSNQYQLVEHAFATISNELRTAFKDALDVDAEPCFVKATKNWFWQDAGITVLQGKLAAAHAAICAENPQTPKICADVLQDLTQIRERHRDLPVVTVDECFEGFKLTVEVRHQILRYLHSIGEVFWLDRDGARDRVVVDVSWIGTFLVGNLLQPAHWLPPNLLADKHGQLTTAQLAARLQLRGEALLHATVILFQLGLCYEARPDVLLFPVLLPESSATTLDVMQATADPDVQEWRLQCVPNEAGVVTDMLTNGFMPLLQTRALQEVGLQGCCLSFHRLVVKKGTMTIGVEQHKDGQAMDIYLTPRDKRANVDTIRWFFELLKKTLDDSCRGATLELLAGSGGKYASLNNVMTKSVEEDAGSALVYSEIEGKFDVLQSLVPWWLYDKLAVPPPEAAVCATISSENDAWKTFVGKCQRVARNMQQMDANWPKDGIVDVTAALRQPIQVLLNDCAVRSKPKGMGVRRNFNYKVVRVEHNQNNSLWAKYSGIRKGIQKSINDKTNALTRIAPESWPSTAAAMAANNILAGAGLQSKEVGEFYFFHGLPAEVVDVVRRGGLDSRIANLEGFYGAGVYLAEDPEKSLVYASNPTVLLLVRAVLGHAFLTSDPEKNVGNRAPCVEGHHDTVQFVNHNGRRLALPPVKRWCMHEECHSMVASPAVGRSGQVDNIPCREFIVYSHVQCYPEYIIHLEPR